MIVGCDEKNHHALNKTILIKILFFIIILLLYYNLEKGSIKHTIFSTVFSICDQNQISIAKFDIVLVI